MAPNSENVAVVYHPNLPKETSLKIEPVDVPSEIGDRQVLLRMAKVGICGSDVHYWTRGRIGPFIVEKPMVLGHEGSAVVEKVGSKVTNLQPGDRVAVEPGVPCRYCNFCKNGRYNLCPDVFFCATPPVDGNLCNYFVWESDFCYKLPDSVSLEEGALLEPLSVAVHACRRGNVAMGSKVLVLGSGPIGLVSLLTARAMAASKVVVTDIADNRLEMATSLGADGVVNVGGKDEAECGRLIVEAFGGAMPDVSIECSGAESSTALGMKYTASGGKMVCVGMGPPEIKIPLLGALCREVDVVGIFRYVNCYPAALELVASQKVNVKPLITHRFKLEESLQAFEVARTGSGGAIKVMISCDE